ncbi:MAG: DUF479 domain-containing protein [Bacteroidetes bacterium HGW-Bacteroidetes-13]|nr:MAG: DUF479 domain-containing protein [Bacteroidetes bacterium HGW-Bacteroidetes-13]
MNFLAHIYLSEGNEAISIGNFIADSVKGKGYTKYSEGIQKGIVIHRSIDFFMDTHPLVKQGADRLFPSFRHYHLVLMDMFYDHLLAKNWSRYSEVPLEVYAENFYQLLEDNIAVLPDKTLRMLPHLRRENWLLQYATLEGLAFILFQMNYRIRHKVDLVSGIEIFKQYETEYESEFEAFFIEVQAFVHEKIISI